MPPDITQVGQIALSVSDIERSIAFYRDDLGLKFLFKAPPGLGFFDIGGVRLMLSQSPKATPGDRTVIYFKVPDINAAFETLSGKGVAFVGKPRLIARMPDHDLWMAGFRDPDANLLELMCEVHR